MHKYVKQQTALTVLTMFKSSMSSSSLLNSSKIAYTHTTTYLSLMRIATLRSKLNTIKN